MAEQQRADRMSAYERGAWGKSLTPLHESPHKAVVPTKVRAIASTTCPM